VEVNPKSFCFGGGGRAKKRVECKLEEELVDRIDRLAELLKTNRTDIIGSVCIAYLKNIEIGAKKGSRTGIQDS
jgi:metal-responsive CopG/Arc/MetJ family transcriptional regulator